MCVQCVSFHVITVIVFFLKRIVKPHFLSINIQQSSTVYRVRHAYINYIRGDLG